MEPLFPNPGGVVDPDDLVGRSAELQRLTEALSHGGAYVTGDRRMGKTSLLAKLEAELASSTTAVIRISAETSRLEVFAGRLIRELRSHRLLRDRIVRWEKEIEGSVGLAVGGTGIKFQARAKRSPEQTTELDLVDLLTSLGDHVGTVLIIDEITVLCQEVGPEVAVEFLRSLRAIRQGRRPVPLVLSGSIGLHHALTDMQSINDLWVVNVGKLAEEEARELTERLLLGVGLADHDEEGELVAQILQETSQIPYYIQAVVDGLRNGGGRDVHALVEQCISENAWNTEHYVSRTDAYYGGDAPLACALLDELAQIFPGCRDVDELMSILAVSTDHRVTRGSLVGLLNRLEKDHYIARDKTSCTMSSGLLARVWRVHRWL